MMTLPSSLPGLCLDRVGRVLMARTVAAVGRPVRLALGAVPARALRQVPRRGSGDVRAHLEEIVTTFVDGYRAAMDASTGDSLRRRLENVRDVTRGFAYEGAAMALALLDAIVPFGAARLVEFIRGDGTAHLYMVHIGAGWAAARMRRGPVRAMRSLDPLLRWLVIDGYGFHEAYFHPAPIVRRGAVPRRMRGYATRAFDQGVGRALWFIEAASPAAIAETVGRLEPHRRPDLWSGVALACAYAGGIETAGIGALRRAAAGYERNLAQGAAFAAEARERAGNPAPHTDDACRVLSGAPATEAARVVRMSVRGLQASADEPAYETWRRLIGAALQP